MGISLPADFMLVAAISTITVPSGYCAGRISFSGWSTDLEVQIASIKWALDQPDYSG